MLTSAAVCAYIQEETLCSPKRVLWLLRKQGRDVFSSLLFAFPDCFSSFSVVKLLGTVPFEGPFPFAARAAFPLFPDHALRIPRFFRFVIQPVV